MGIGCIVLALLWDYILYALDYLLKIMNISSRTLSALINKRLFDTSNRKFIYDLSMEIIKKNGIKISGILQVYIIYDSLALGLHIHIISYLKF